jgi:hypothetical protein
MTAAGRERGELWRVTVDPTTLETGACYADESGSLSRLLPRHGAGLLRRRLARARRRGPRALRLETPLVLHLGTFPWVYSSRLEAVGPGLRWSRRAPSRRSRACTSWRLLEPETNLRQDARQVAAIYRHFAAHTARCSPACPPSSPAAPRSAACTSAAASCTCIRAACTSPASTARAAASPRRPTTTSARFACFFAVRRATLRALAWLPAEVQRLARPRADPCLRQHAEEVARAG